MQADPSLFAPDFKEQPYWWEAAPRPTHELASIPTQIDGAIVGSGYTGLSAALTLARAGRSVAVIEAEDPGYGASSRNAGVIGKALKHTFHKLMTTQGLERAFAVYYGLDGAFEYVIDFIEREQIQCHFNRCGRLIGALSARQYESIAREYELQSKHLGLESEVLPRSELHRETGSDIYHGGVVVPSVATIHPGLYQLGLLDRVQTAGAQVIANTRVTGISREQHGFSVDTDRGRVQARDVMVATNGYTTKVTPYFRRRVIPFHAYMIATEPCEELHHRLLPQGRICLDTNRNLNFMRPSPDGRRLLFGGRTGIVEPDLKVMATKLHQMLTGIFPDMKNVCLSHVWTGYCSATFDFLPRHGVRDGVHYAMGYCFAGVAMGTYLGHKTALRILEAPNSATVFGDRSPPSRFYYWGKPWFLRPGLTYWDWLDRRGAA